MVASVPELAPVLEDPQVVGLPAAPGLEGPPPNTYDPGAGTDCAAGEIMFVSPISPLARTLTPKRVSAVPHVRGVPAQRGAGPAGTQEEEVGGEGAEPGSVCWRDATEAAPVPGCDVSAFLLGGQGQASEVVVHEGQVLQSELAQAPSCGHWHVGAGQPGSGAPGGPAQDLTHEHWLAGTGQEGADGDGEGDGEGEGEAVMELQVKAMAHPLTKE